MKLKEIFKGHRWLAALLAIAVVLTTVLISTGVGAQTAVLMYKTTSANSNYSSVHTATTQDVTHTVLKNTIPKTVKLTVVDSDAFYARNEKDFHFQGLNDGTSSALRDISGIISTGYIRFFVKAPKAMQMNVRLIASGWSRSNAPKALSLVKTIENGGYYEYHIPLSELAGTNITWSDSKLLERITISPISEDTFLSEGDELYISPFEIYDGEPDYAFTQAPIAEMVGTSTYHDEQSSYLSFQSNSETGHKISIADGYYSQTYGMKGTSLLFKSFKKNGTAMNGDISGYINTAVVRAYIKTPIDTKLKFWFNSNENYGWQNRGSVEVDVKSTNNGEDYTEVIVPLKNFNSSYTFSNIGVGPAESVFSADKFITTDQSIYIKSLEIWTNNPNSDTNEYKKIATTTYQEEQSNYLSFQSNAQTGYQISISDGYYSQTYGMKGTCLLLKSFKDNGVAFNGDISGFSDTAVLKTQIKTPVDTKLRFWFNSNENYGWQNRGFVEVDVESTNGGQDYTEVIVPLQNFNSDHLFNNVGVGPAESVFAADKFITTEQSIFIKPLELWTGYDAPEPEPDPDPNPDPNPNPNPDPNPDPPADVTAEKLAVTSYWENQSSCLEIKGVSIDKKSLMYGAFQSSYRMILKEGFYAQDLTQNGRNKTTFYIKSFKGVKEGVADGAQNFTDISTTAYIRFFVKTPKNIKLNVYIMNGWGEQTKKTVDVSASAEGTYTEVQIPLADALATSRTVTQIGIGAPTDTFNDTAFVAEGESIEVSHIELWSAKPEAYVPAEIPDEYWLSLPEQSADAESFKLAESDTNFWTNDWNDKTRDRSIQITRTSIEKKDPLYKYFNLYYSISVLDADVYYKMTAGNRDITVGLGGSQNLEEYLKTGYIRFYIRATKDMRVRIEMSDKGWHRTQQYVDIKKTEENLGWQEVQIPLKAFYDAQNGTVNFKEIARIMIESTEDGFNEDGFLKEKLDVLEFSAVEFWSKKPAVPQDVDIRDYYYSEYGNGIILRDSDEIIPLANTFLAYENSEDTKTVSTVLENGYHDFKISKIISAYVLVNESINTYRSDPYSKVEIMIPNSMVKLSPDIKIARVDESTGEVEAVKYTTEGEYIILNTAGMGDFVFFTGKDGGIVKPSQDDGEEKDAETVEETVTKVIKVKRPKPKQDEFNWLPWAIGGGAGAVALGGAVWLTVYLIKKKKVGQ